MYQKSEAWIYRFQTNVTLADCFDAITTTRSYQAAKSTEHALKILEKISGSHLGPSLVTTFIQEIRKNTPYLSYLTINTGHWDL